MRGLDNSAAVSPEWWEGGRPQRARHMSALESGTQMSPCARGYRWPARDALCSHDVVGAPRHGGERVWEVWVGCCTAEAAKPASAERGIAHARTGQEQPRALHVTRRSFPNPRPCTPIPPSHIDHVSPRSSRAVRKGEGAAERPMMPMPTSSCAAHRSPFRSPSPALALVHTLCTSAAAPVARLAQSVAL
jgi:hypothetical protein